MKIQKNIRVSPEVAKWMDSHPLSNNALVTYALHLLMQIEHNAKRTPEVHGQIYYVPSPNDSGYKPPF
jgi:hypothetical protein